MEEKADVTSQNAIFDVIYKLGKFHRKPSVFGTNYMCFL